MIESFLNALGRSVVAGDSAENIGAVKSFVVSEDAGHICSIHIGGHRRGAMFLAWQSVGSFGPDAIVAKARPETGWKPDRFGVDLIGSRVLTTTGFIAGKVLDVRFETTDGSVVSVETDAGSIDAARLRSVGLYALVVAPSVGG